MSTIVPTISGPKRPQDKVLLTDASKVLIKVLKKLQKKKIFQFLKFQIQILKLKMVQF
jgi:aconitate hydratase